MASLDGRSQKVSNEVKEKIGDLGLTSMQTDFVNYFLFITGMDAVEALKLAGYSHGVNEKENIDPLLRENFIRMRYQTMANDFLKNPKIVKTIGLIKAEMNDSLIVDKLWVLKKLKSLAEKGSENTQLQATKLLGQHLSMFVEVQKVEQVEDPASIARAGFEARKNNIVDFNTEKDGTDE